MTSSDNPSPRPLVDIVKEVRREVGYTVPPQTRLKGTAMQIYGLLTGQTRVRPRVEYDIISKAAELATVESITEDVYQAKYAGRDVPVSKVDNFKMYFEDGVRLYLRHRDEGIDERTAVGRTIVEMDQRPQV